MSAVVDTLAKREIVEWPAGFRLYTRLSGASRSIKPGVYEIRRGTAWPDILEKLRSGDVIEVRLAVPEGWNSTQIAERIATTFQAPADSVASMVLDSAVARRLGVPGPTLEGYLYPATYVLPITTPARSVIAAMVRRYREAWSPAFQARADSLGLSEREVITLASIVEKEAKQWSERDTIAAVYHNRLRIGMPLQADPTVQYALPQYQSRLLNRHLSVRSPYNTYVNKGLPPGPIGAPGVASIEASIYPADVPYLYFVAWPDGHHEFRVRLDEHQAEARRARRAWDALRPAVAPAPQPTTTRPRR